MRTTARRASALDGRSLRAATLTVLMACSGAPKVSISRTPMAGEAMTLPAWLPGVWTREYIDRRGARSDVFAIHYLQTPTLFADVRIRRDRPSMSHAASFADLSHAELLALATQRGFVGATTASGLLATWHHEIDFQPPDGSADVGRLERVDDAHMLEHALDSSYIESWQSTAPGEQRFLAIRVERNGRLVRMLLVAGDHFLFVRNREQDLPAAESLDSLIVQSRATRAEIVEYLDCELSYGVVSGDSTRWQILQSTLPWREGRRLDFVDEIEATSGGDSLALRTSTGDHWSMPVNTFSSGDLRALFDHHRGS